MHERVTADELLQFPVFEGESREAIEWLAGQMELLHFEVGAIVAHEGGPLEHFIVVLQGELHFQWSASDSIVIAPAGQATGVLPFSRAKTWTARGWAAQATRIARMPASQLRELVYRAPLLAQRLVSEMTDRARYFTRLEESSNRLLALGKLSAGLAHELNNPASAAVRSSARLRDVLVDRRKYAIALRSVVLPKEAGEILARLTDTIAECGATAPGEIDALARADQEAEMGDWLESLELSGELAAALVDAHITVEQLRPLPALLSGETLDPGLRLLAADHEILCLARELEEATRRISDLVLAVKTYSYMDQSPIAEVDLAQGIDVTLRMFQHRLKRGIEVSRQFAAGLPRIHANGSALNQVWTNLIDNALDAMEGLPPEKPKLLTVRTCAEPTGVLVEIADTGPGIPEDVQRRIFEPFFTTKGVGEGSGLGLDIVQRIVRNHRGSILVDSSPGRTVFQVRLPTTIE